MNKRAGAAGPTTTHWTSVLFASSTPDRALRQALGLRWTSLLRLEHCKVSRSMQMQTMLMQVVKLEGQELGKGAIIEMLRKLITKLLSR